MNTREYKKTPDKLANAITVGDLTPPQPLKSPLNGDFELEI